MAGLAELEVDAGVDVGGCLDLDSLVYVDVVSEVEAEVEVAGTGEVDVAVFGVVGVFGVFFSILQHVLELSSRTWAQ